MTRAAAPLRVAVLWHMHQPCYRDPADGTYILPWVRLHALRDYLGMVEVLEPTPGVHVTFNLAPSLLDQVEDYARGTAREPVLALSEKPAAALTRAERMLALHAFSMVHPNLVRPLPRYAELLERKGSEWGEDALAHAATRFGDDDFRDLQVLGKLAWFDLSWQQWDPVVRSLMEKGRGYSEEDKVRLAERERALLSSIVPAYRRAAERGQVELSTSPYYHPILPLLCDTDAHHEAHPHAPLPPRFQHPEDAADQLARAAERHAALFGERPRGVWPSEGSVSDVAVAEIARAGFRWAASDEAVLGRTLQRHMGDGLHPARLDLLYRPWERATEHGPVRMLFRDRVLSDLIGFSYQHSAPGEAAADMIGRLRGIGAAWAEAGLEGQPVVPVILDGENAWEHYRDGGRDFLRALYAGLERDPHLQAVTMDEAVRSVPPRELPRVFAGSWIHADFSVWIGHPDDVRAWELLGHARQALSEAEGRVGADALEGAREAYRAACGSDWCWWYGEDHSSANDLDFDRLFRRHLQAVYRGLGLPVPTALESTLISTQHHVPRVSPPVGALVIAIDGEASKDEWGAAGRYTVPMLGAMHRGEQAVRALRFGSGDGQLHVLVETVEPARQTLGNADVAVVFQGVAPLRYRVSEGASCVREVHGPGGWQTQPSAARAAAGAVLEVSIPRAELETEAPALQVVVLRRGIELERHPESGPIVLHALGAHGAPGPGGE